MKFDKIIFVCTGNTCRSPMAEYMMKYQWQDKDNTEIISRGIAAFSHEPMNPKTVRALEVNEIPYEQRTGKALNEKDLEGRVLILTMTQGHKLSFKNAGKKDDYPVIYTIKEFAGEDGDVKDPYGMSERAYDLCYLELERLIGKVINRLKGDE